MSSIHLHDHSNPGQSCAVVEPEDEGGGVVIELRTYKFGASVIPYELENTLNVTLTPQSARMLAAMLVAVGDEQERTWR